jgi:hypothetical protein
MRESSYVFSGEIARPSSILVDAEEQFNQPILVTNTGGRHVEVSGSVTWRFIRFGTFAWLIVRTIRRRDVVVASWVRLVLRRALRVDERAQIACRHVMVLHEPARTGFTTRTEP